jgi:hypothetical protein
VDDTSGNVDEVAGLDVVLFPVNDEDHPAIEQQEVLLGLIVGVRSRATPLGRDNLHRTVGAAGLPTQGEEAEHMIAVSLK